MKWRTRCFRSVLSFEYAVVVYLCGNALLPGSVTLGNSEIFLAELFVRCPSLVTEPAGPKFMANKVLDESMLNFPDLGAGPFERAIMKRH